MHKCDTIFKTCAHRNFKSSSNEKKSNRKLAALIKVIEPTVLLLVDKGLKWQTLAK